jgi:dihydropteroate synthase
MQNYKSNSFHGSKLAIKCGNLNIDFSEPLVMGILNVTPDSFFDGGLYTTQQAIVDRAGQMLEDGAAILDLGAYSTRPGAANVSPEEELERMLPAVEVIRKEFPEAMLSIDTFRAIVAEKVVQQFGPCIINDISGGTMDDEMFATVGRLQVPYIMMHIKGTPQTMQENPQYQDLMGEVKDFFAQRLEQLKLHGVKDVILDPGFGFGKTLDHNYEMMDRLNEFHELNLPLLVGISRKSMIFRLLGVQPDQSLNGTTVLNTLSLMNGANILRVHDVREAVEAVKIFMKMKSRI